MVKRMTQREKKRRAEIRKRMQDEGILPPDKQRLNRKGYTEAARKEWQERNRDCILWDCYLHEAIACMLNHRDRNFKVSLEAVGVAKCLKLAIRLDEFYRHVKEEGGKYTYDELHEYIKDILEA